MTLERIKKDQAHWDEPKGMDIQTGLVIEVAAISDVGCQRTNNEDNFGYDLQSQLFVVCDGMGGMAAGEVASRMAVDQLLLFYEGLRSAEMDIEKRLHQAVVRTNRVVWATAQENEQLRGMGTTLVAACVDGSRVVIGNIGDSRAYFLRDGECAQITQDHSYVAERMPNSKDDLGPLRQFITRAVGVEEMVRPDLFTAEVQSGDIVVLATDGLTRYAEAEEIVQHIGNGLDLAGSCRKFVETTKEQGAVDNVTCLLLRFQ